MRLVVDTNVLVGELLRVAGRTRLGDKRIDLFLPEQMWGEAQVELPRRIAAFIRRRSLKPALGTELAEACHAAIEANIAVLDESIYAPLEDEARERSLRDPHDWPVVASALALSAAIWTNDNDFLGTGVATWTEPGARWGLNRAGVNGPVMGGEGQSMALRGRHDQPIYMIGVEALRQLIMREHLPGQRFGQIADLQEWHG